MGWAGEVSHWDLSWGVEKREDDIEGERYFWGRRRGDGPLGLGGVSEGFPGED